VALGCFNDSKLTSIDLATGDARNVFTSPVPISVLEFSRAGDWIVLGDENGGLKLFSFPDLAPLASLGEHASALRSCAIDPTDEQVLSGDRAGMLILHDRLSGRVLLTIQAFPRVVTRCAFSPDGRMLLATSGVPAQAGGNDFRIRCWEASSGREAASLDGHTNAVTAWAFPAGCNHLITGGHDGNLHIWQIPEEAAPVLPRPHQGVVTTCAFSADGSRFATVGKDRLVIWDASKVQTLDQAPLTEEDGFWNSTFAPSGQELILCGRMLGRYSLAGKALARLHKTPSSVLSMGECSALSPDASLYAIGTTGGFSLGRSETQDIHTVFVCRAKDGEILARLEGHGGAVNSVAFHPEGQSILSGSSDSTVRGWSLGGGLLSKPRSLFTFKGHRERVTACAFHPGGQMAVSADAGGNILLWEAGSQKILQSCRGHASYVSSLVFSKDGRFLLSAGFDNRIEMWEIPALRPVACLPTIGRPICASLSPTGSLGCVGEESGNVYIFRLSFPQEC
jgi:WD40 repeat protein